MIHQTGKQAIGWGAEFLEKRAQPNISLTFREPNWYQEESFFDALAAIRSFAGAKAELSCYGSSMGGYGAILAARSLGASRVVAFCPQYSIWPSQAPFERRFRESAVRIGGCQWDISREFSSSVDYLLLIDPTHTLDRKQRALFPNYTNWRNIPVSGGGHGPLNALLQMGLQDHLLNLLVGDLSPSGFREAVRQRRAQSYNYVRRLGNLTTKRHPKFSGPFVQLALDMGNRRLIRKWRGEASIVEKRK